MNGGHTWANTPHSWFFLTDLFLSPIRIYSIQYQYNIPGTVLHDPTVKWINDRVLYRLQLIMSSARKVGGRPWRGIDENEEIVILLMYCSCMEISEFLSDKGI